MARFRDGQEAESGVIRRDPARLCGRRDDQKVSEEVQRAPADGAASAGERDPSGTKEARTEESEDGSVAGGNRPHSGSGPASAAQAAAHGASHLGAASGGTPGTSNRRSHGATVRTAVEADIRLWGP